MHNNVTHSFFGKARIILRLRNWLQQLKKNLPVTQKIDYCIQNL
jgi:hypothetical protein